VHHQPSEIGRRLIPVVNQILIYKTHSVYQKLPTDREIALHERLLPLVVLSELLKLDQPATSSLPDERFVVVTQVGSQVFGMIVDQVFDTEEIVVKPMGSINRHLSMFSGNTILGDGSVIMILDPGGVAGALGNANAAAEAAARSEAEHHTAEAREKSTLLVFRAGSGAPKAVPLQQIARLEEFERKDIESISDRYVTQYRGKLIPVVSLDPMGGVNEESRQPALVFADEGRVMALLVDTVVDILETEIDIHHSRSVPGVMGSAIIAGHATELIDAGYFCEQAFQGWSEPADWSGARHDGLDEIDPSAAAAVNPTSGSLEMARAA
jgi:two-component system chemotaxis sensor kinase CheA